MQLYRGCWHVELFFKWLKHHLRIKAFYGTSQNAVRTQIWIAISVYLLVAILKKRLHTDLSLYTYSLGFESDVLRENARFTSPFTLNRPIPTGRHTNSTVFTGLFNRTLVDYE